MAELSQLSFGILLDIVDEEWMRDILPDDDVPFPPGVAPAMDDTEDLNNQEQPLKKVLVSSEVKLNLWRFKSTSADM
ncbi:hypothetical protein GOP47_0024731 [Adiantum capillus-veneris]|uniref:Anaphase-promoting complex subunit 13 n=1 Tax=Adiantum capillus-veneris TaxID=13818 RepID=A0A9D4Z5B0_ADICA|nr:hypothetical protein GOP47_0024731 [Adiantum capillus-veneris]